LYSAHLFVTLTPEMKLGYNGSKF